MSVIRWAAIEPPASPTLVAAAVVSAVAQVAYAADLLASSTTYPSPVSPPPVTVEVSAAGSTILVTVSTVACTSLVSYGLETDSSVDAAPDRVTGTIDMPAPNLLGDGSASPDCVQATATVDAADAAASTIVTVPAPVLGVAGVATVDAGQLVTNYVAEVDAVVAPAGVSAVEITADWVVVVDSVAASVGIDQPEVVEGAGASLSPDTVEALSYLDETVPIVSTTAPGTRAKTRIASGSSTRVKIGASSP